MGDVAIMAVIDEEQKDEVDEYEEYKDGMRRTVYNTEEGTWNYGKKRVTDLKGNTMVYLPGKLKNFQDEANLELLRAEMKYCFKQYMREKCDDEGRQESNISKEELRGLKTLKKRVKNEEIVVLPTDKSGRFGVMSMENYMRAGSKHTGKDEKVEMSVVTKTQNELNGNMSMAIKFFRIGHLWKHGERVRSTMINNSLAICPMYLTYKDHKGWTGEDKSPPPTRPIAGGNSGMNIHISEVLSEIIEPVVDAYEGGQEIISTEDCKARIEILNGKNEDWDKWKWWDGVRTEDKKYECCIVCTRKFGDDKDDGMRTTAQLRWMGETLREVSVEEIEKYGCKCLSEEEIWLVENWENFWDTPAGQNTAFWTGEDGEFEDKPKKTTAEVIRRLRRKEWLDKQKIEDLENVEKIWEPHEVLQEDIQNFSESMVVIGSDVESLYPSLDIEDCMKVIEEEVMRTSIQWKDLDYFRGQGS